MFALGTPSHHHLELVLHDGASPGDVRAALAGLGRPSALAGGVNVVVGFSPTLWTSLGGWLPDGDDGRFPTIPEVPHTPADVWVWLHADAPDTLFDAALSVVAAFAPVAHVVREVSGFHYHSSRDLIGFEDGTENPAPEDAPGVALVADGPAAGGSWAITQRWVHDLGAFGALPLAEQEEVVGRTREGSIELVEDRMPLTSHVRRTVVEDDDGTELAIWRRSTPYGTATEHGLHFVAFCNVTSTITLMLQRMYGVTDGVRDRLTEFSRPVTGAYWWVPSVDQLVRLFGLPPEE